MGPSSRRAGDDVSNMRNGNSLIVNAPPVAYNEGAAEWLLAGPTDHLAQGVAEPEEVLVYAVTPESHGLLADD
jgi:hypothetical protein